MQVTITDNPETNMETLWNFCRYKEGKVIFAETMQGKNTDTFELCKKFCAEKCGSFKDTELMDFLDCMIDCQTCVDCPVSLLYISAIQAAELRARLMELEDEKEAEEDENV